MTEQPTGAGVIHEVLEGIHYIYDETQLAETVLKTVAKALNAEAGTIFTIRDDQTLHPLACFAVPVEKLRRVKIKVGEGIAGWVAQYAQPAKSDEAAKDPRFLSSVDKSTGFRTKNVIAAPILTHGKAVGVIEFLNRKDAPFGARDLELISMIGREVGIAFENVRLIRSLEGALAFQEALLRSLSAGIIILDQRGRLLRMNPAAEHILALDFPSGENEPQSASKLLRGLPQLVKVLEAAARSDEPVSRQEMRLTVRGQLNVIGYSCVPIFSKNGTRLGSALLFQDITPFASNK